MNLIYHMWSCARWKNCYNISNHTHFLLSFAFWNFTHSVNDSSFFFFRPENSSDVIVPFEFSDWWQQERTQAQAVWICDLHMCYFSLVTQLIWSILMMESSGFRLSRRQVLIELTTLLGCNFFYLYSKLQICNEFLFFFCIHLQSLQLTHVMYGDVFTTSSEYQNWMEFQNSRGSTNRTDDGGAVVQSSSSPAAGAALPLAATDVIFLMHQTSSSHEKRRQCGTAAAAGSSGATSAATTAHAGLLRATLWAWRQSVRRSAAPAGPDMWRP